MDSPRQHFEPRQFEPLLRRVAVAAAAGSALVSLLQHVPVWVACARGGASLACVLVIGKLGLYALERAAQDEQAAQSRTTVRVARETERS
ncbi:MAG: hypothetical protein EPO68_04065, partial [Planctomycetota bacterium]